jgi:hypothetical protein
MEHMGWGFPKGLEIPRRVQWFLIIFPQKCHFAAFCHRKTSAFSEKVYNDQGGHKQNWDFPNGWYPFIAGWFVMDIPITLWLFNIAMENCPFIDDFPIKTSIYKGFSIC